MRGMCMVDEVLLNKAAIIERCVARAHEEYDFLAYARQIVLHDAAQ